MPHCTVETEEREFKVHRQVPVLRVRLEPDEVDKILLKHITEQIAPKHLAGRAVASATISADISRGEYLNCYEAELVFNE